MQAMKGIKLDKCFTSLYNNHDLYSLTQRSVPKHAPHIQYTYLTQHSTLKSVLLRLPVTQVCGETERQTKQHAESLPYRIVSDRRVVSSSL